MGNMWSSGSQQMTHNTDDRRERWSLRREEEPDPPPPVNRPRPHQDAPAQAQQNDMPARRQK